MDLRSFAVSVGSIHSTLLLPILIPEIQTNAKPKKKVRDNKAKGTLGLASAGAHGSRIHLAAGEGPGDDGTGEVSPPRRSWGYGRGRVPPPPRRVPSGAPPPPQGPRGRRRRANLAPRAHIPPPDLHHHLFQGIPSPRRPRRRPRARHPLRRRRQDHRPPPATGIQRRGHVRCRRRRPLVLPQRPLLPRLPRRRLPRRRRLPPRGALPLGDRHVGVQGASWPALRPRRRRRGLPRGVRGLAQLFVVEVDVCSHQLPCVLAIVLARLVTAFMSRFANFVSGSSLANTFYT
uniref:Uncharacterized protein n=1 Tax=Oryza punctata TaxID=4537 RepID=A0A0E0K387_ORYPU